MKNTTENQRYVLGLSYLGQHFHGWQRQPNQLDTIQKTLEQACALIAQHQIKIICAGRTDAGVHALEQIVHFDSTAARTHDNWLRGLNTLLPKTIRIHWVCTVPQTFHARFSAIERQYRYVIDQAATENALTQTLCHWCPGPLDTTAMQQAMNYWLGCHDFSAFRASGCQAYSPIRQLNQATITEQDSYLTLTFSANAFLYHMIRNMVGTLLLIGQQKKPAQFAYDLLQGKDRSKAPDMAAAKGLTLSHICYPDPFNLPNKQKKDKAHTPLPLT